VLEHVAKQVGESGGFRLCGAGPGKYNAAAVGVA
jgi:hypothetical protein